MKIADSRCWQRASITMGASHHHQTLGLKSCAALACVIIAFLALASCGDDASDRQPLDYSAAIQQTTQAIDKAMKDYSIVGLSIALVDGERVVWTQGFGYADKAGNVAATADTVFQVGSISKPLTAIAAMQLVEQGQLDLDAPLVRYLPEFSINNRIPGVDLMQITPRLLLTHHAGLPYDAQFLMSYTFRPEERERVPELLRNDWLCFAPNTVYGYSNLGATLMGLVVERVSGLEFTAYTDTHLFAAMGMPMSSFAPKPQMEPYLSKDYDSQGEEARYVHVNSLSAGSALSSATDMARFIKTLLAEGRNGAQQIVTPASLREMWTRQNGEAQLDFDFQFGLYWILTDPEFQYAGKAVGFAGDSVHQHSRLILLPDQQLGVFVVNNCALGGAVARSVAVTALQSALKEKAGLTPPIPPAQPPVASLPPETLVGYAGLYTGAAGGVVTLTVEGDHLRADNTMADLSYTLTPLADGSFAITGLPGQENHTYVFETVEGWQVLVDKWLGVKLLPFLTKVNPPSPRQAWKNRSGIWVIDNSEDFYPYYSTLELKEHNGVMIAIINNAQYFALDTISDTEAVNVGLGTYRGDTVRIAMKDGSERIYFDNYLFRKADTQ